MQIIPISQCSNELQISRYRVWPAMLPAYAWRHYLVSNFSSQIPNAVCIGETAQDLGKLLSELYPEPSLVEISYLKRNLEKLNLMIFDEVLDSMKIPLNDNFTSTILIIPHLPKRFQDWIHHRKCSVKDLSPLRSVTDLISVSSLLNAIANLNPSRQFGVQILELAVELHLLDQPNLEPNEGESVEAWQSRLKTLRYPMTSALDQKSKEKIAELAWPPQVDVNWQRLGDQTGVQVKFFAQSQIDFEKKILGIESICQKIKDKPELLWKN